MPIKLFKYILSHEELRSKNKTASRYNFCPGLLMRGDSGDIFGHNVGHCANQKTRTPGGPVIYIIAPK